MLLQTKVSLIGIGMGGRDTLTLGAWRALRECDCLLGAQRMTDAFSELSCPKFHFIAPDDIVSFLRKHSEFQKVGVVYSGDTGFYSGAEKLRVLLQKEGLEPEEFCGVSSLSYFCSRLHTSWENARLISAHGRRVDPALEVRYSAKVFFLAGSPGVEEICESLCAAGFGGLQAAVGERLSYPEERIVRGTVQELSERAFAPLSVLLVWNSNPQKIPFGFGLPDEAFTRGKAPMTKSEVRCISLSRLCVEPEDIVYDVGAGTGSVSIELSRLAWRGVVYGIERDDDALAVAAQNREKFQCGNLVLRKGEAPEALKDLPAPTCAFIGGSSGALAEVIELLIKKNPAVRIVINAITLETLGLAVETMERLGMKNVEIAQIGVAKTRKAGRYHMMASQNPVFIISARGAEK